MRACVSKFVIITKIRLYYNSRINIFFNDILSELVMRSPGDRRSFAPDINTAANLSKVNSSEGGLANRKRFADIISPQRDRRRKGGFLMCNLNSAVNERSPVAWVWGNIFLGPAVSF